MNIQSSTSGFPESTQDVTTLGHASPFSSAAGDEYWFSSSNACPASVTAEADFQPFDYLCRARKEMLENRESRLEKPVWGSEGRILERSVVSFREKMNSTSHHDVTITYLKCTDGGIVLLAHQHKLIDDFNPVSCSSFNVVGTVSGHCPTVTFADETAEFTTNATGRV